MITQDLVNDTEVAAALAAPVVATTDKNPELAKKLRKEMAAVRLHRGRWGIRKRLDADQVKKAADSFGADDSFLAANKRLINNRAKEYQDCCRTLREAASYWRSVTIPYPEDGVRLIRRDRLEKFAETLKSLKAQLHEQAKELQVSYEELIADAKERLGVLFNSLDYPTEVSHLFKLEWDFPSVEPPSYLTQCPALYEQEKARIQARFEEAIRLTEEAFVEQFHGLVTHLAERLQFGEDGKPKVFRDTAVEGLQEFFAQFNALNVGSNEELDALVAKAQEIVGTVDPSALRKDVTKREEIKTAMVELSQKLDGMMVARPARAMSMEDDE